MYNIIKEFERMLSHSIMYYPDPNKNIAASFKVVFPEIYYDKFKDLNDRQKEIISKFVIIYLKNLSDLEKYNNSLLDNEFLNFDKDKTKLLNKQHISYYFIEYFKKYINPYEDIKFDDRVPFLINIKNNKINRTSSSTFISKKHTIYGISCNVYIKIHSKYINAIELLIKKHKICCGLIKSEKNIFLFYVITVFDNEITKISNMEKEDINKYFGE
ncbi:hypothetical protein [Pigmentibacter ruber]|uniref:hypothetical protein n=1 Tax=Pigmentibacter ruber TaxID=2683196 RepID=UPI00131E7749|nr:hypothetical protein [Pigmentibacter ruber]